MAMMMMVVNSATTNMVTVVARPWTRCRACCSPSSVVSSHQLRSELDQLHSEADMARTKANNARLRLMRLSEAAEITQTHRQLSVFKLDKKIMQGIFYDKRKRLWKRWKSQRGGSNCLTKLSAKLNESEEDVNGVVYGDHRLWNISEVMKIFRFTVRGQYNDEAKFGSETTDNKSILNENGIIGSLRDISSYEEFLEHLDGQLNIIEAELAILIRLSTLVLEREEMPQNSKVHQTLEILEGIRSIRERSV
ncbi:unnamed protein product [Rhodiola kirilowii]